MTIQKSTLIILLLLFSSFHVSAEVFSGVLSESPETIELNNPVIKEMKIGFAGKNTSFTITEANYSVDNFRIFKSYKIDDKEDNIQYIRFKFNMSNFFDKEGLHGGNTVVFNGKNLASYDLDENNSLYSSYIPQPAKVIYIGGPVDLSEEGVLAVNPQKTLCTQFLNPNSSFEVVDDCEGELTSGKSLNFLIDLLEKHNKVFILLLSLLIGIFLSTKVYKYREEDKLKEDIADITEEIVKGMKNGDIKRNKKVLKNLEKANKLAYSGKYEKANNLVKQARRKIKLK